MKIYGSLNNRLMEGAKQPEPAMGMGATIIWYSDRDAGTIVNVAPETIIVQQDRAIRSDSNGMSDCQSYGYERDATGTLTVFRKDRRGKWREASLNSKTNRWHFVEGGKGLLLGHRDAYHDYGF